MASSCSEFMSQTQIILNKIIDTGIKSQASYIHLEVGAKPTVRIAGKLAVLEGNFVADKEFLENVAEVILPPDKRQELNDKKATALVHVFEGDKRFRINVFFKYIIRFIFV